MKYNYKIINYIIWIRFLTGIVASAEAGQSRNFSVDFIPTVRYIDLETIAGDSYGRSGSFGKFEK